ncbi:MAG TPA: hypothetical protein VGG15_11915 [Terriglobales bacterium]|jgi:hypothetical protein
MRSESETHTRQTWIASLAAMTALLACTSFLNAQNAQVRSGVGIYPPSSIEQPADVGLKMHTNYIIYAPTGSIAPAAQPGGDARILRLRV